jgi:Ca2+-binding RTX toxin-like protein
VTFTVTAATAPTVATILNYQITGTAVGTSVAAASAADFATINGSVTIAAGATTGTFTVTPVNEGVAEGYEGFKVSLLDSGYNTVATSGNVVIADGAVAASAGQTFALTTGTNSFTGTTGDDTFDAGISSSSLQTLNSGDSLDGGAGTDTLYAVITSSVTPSALKNIENIYVTNTTTAASVDFSNATGVTSLSNAASTVALTLSGISKSGPAVTVRDTAIAGQVVAFNDVSGTADSATVVLNNVSGAASLTVAGVETLTLQSDGSATNVLASLTSAAATTVKITGSQGFTSTAALGSTVTTLDASANTNTTTGVTAIFGTTNSTSITGSAGNDSFTITSSGVDSIDAGAGRDTVWYSTGTWTTADNVNGGEGTDTLRTLAASQAGVATPTTYKTSGFETIQITDALAAAIYTPANISATATTLNITGNTDNTGATNSAGAALSVTGATIVGPAGSFAVGLGTSLATNVSGRLVNVGTLTITDTGTATTDSLTLTNNARVTSGAALDVFNAAVLPISGYETVTINTGSASGVQQTIGAITLAGDLSADATLNFTGVNAVQLTGTATANKIDASGITAAGTGSTTTTAAFYMAGAPTATTVIGSAGFDVIYGHASSASSVDGGAGNDSIIGGSGNDTLLGGAGIDTLTAGAGNDSIDAGAGNDTIVFAGNLASGDVVNGGDGIDTLTVSSGIAAAAASTISNIEIIGYTATTSQDMSAFLNSGITTLQETTGVLTVTNAQASLNTLILGAAGASAVTGASLTRLVDGTNDSLSILLVDGTLNTTTLTTPSFANEENITIGEYGADSTAAVTFALGTVTATSLLKLSVTGSNNHSLTLSGNSSTTTINASASTGTFNLAGNGSATAQTITGPLTAAATLTGGSAADSIVGGAVADSLVGGAGNDTITGNAGDDTINGGLGVDSLVGGDGTDTISVNYTATSNDGGSATPTGMIVNLSSSAITAATVITNMTTTTGSATSTILSGDLSTVASNTSTYLGAAGTVSSRVDTLSGFENVIGHSTLNNYIVGSSAANSITGGGVADYIEGGAGDDTITGGAGADIINVGSGTDTVVFAPEAATTTYDVVTGMGTGDVLKWTGANGTETFTTTGVTFDTNIATTYTAAAAGNGSVNSAIKWFTTGGDAYLVIDNTAGATAATTDAIIKIVGVTDLSGATFSAANDTLTLA